MNTENSDVLVSLKNKVNKLISLYTEYKNKVVNLEETKKRNRMKLDFLSLKTHDFPRI